MSLAEKAAESKAAFQAGDFKTASRLFHEVRVALEADGKKAVQLGDGTVALETLGATGEAVHLPVE